MNENPFKRGDAVKFEYLHRGGTAKGKGTVGARQPSGRIEIKLDDGSTRNLWPSQLKAA